jgi:hypothetical protein
MIENCSVIFHAREGCESFYTAKTLERTSGALTVQRLGWVFAELLAVLTGKAPKLTKSEAERNFFHSDFSVRLRECLPGCG